MELNEAQKSQVAEIANRYCALLDRGDHIDPKDPAIVAGLTHLYKLFELPLPEIEICDSPVHAIRRAKELGEPRPSFDRVGLADAGWLTNTHAHVELGLADPEKDQKVKDALILRDYLFAGGYDSVLLDERALVIRFPAEVHVDREGQLHGETGPAIRWRDGYSEYAWHGVWVTERLVMNPESYTKEEILAERSTEVRRALAERLTWVRMLEKLESSLVNEWTDPKTSLHYALYEVKLESSGETSKFLKKQSPPLTNGAQPFYAEPVHRLLRTAQAARKWQVIAGTMDPTEAVEKAESDPELVYGREL